MKKFSIDCLLEKLFFLFVWRIYLFIKNQILRKVYLKTLSFHSKRKNFWIPIRFLFSKTSENGQSMVIEDMLWQWSWGYFLICRLCWKISGGLFLKYCLQSNKIFFFLKDNPIYFCQRQKVSTNFLSTSYIAFFFFRHFISRRKCYLITVLSLCFLFFKSKRIFLLFAFSYLISRHGRIEIFLYF